MALSYGGIELIVPTREISDRIADTLDPWELHEFCIRSWPGKNLTGITFAGHVPLRPVRVGSLYWPTGASRWAVGYFLASDNQLDAIRQQAYPSQPLVPVPLPLTISSNQSLKTITASMYMLPPRPLYQFPGTNGLNLLTLVDQRYFWWLRTGGILAVDGSTAWSDLYAALGGQIGAPILADAVPCSYFSPNPALASNYESLPILLDAIAYNVGQRITVALQGDVTAQSLGTCFDALQENLVVVLGEVGATVKKGGQFSSLPDLTAILPAAVQVTFQQGSSVYARTANLLGLTDANGIFDFSPYAGSPGEKTFHDTALALSGSPPANDDDLWCLTQRIASDFYGFHLAASLDQKFNGIIPWNPDGLHDITWTYQLDQVTTRVRRSTFNSDNEELLHSINDPSPAGGSTTTSTTTTPVPCVGVCKWTWDNSARKWNLTSQTCGQGTTTTTTDSGTTTTSSFTTTTTTTCCPRSTTSTTIGPSTSSTSTTTTTTAAPCSCLPPQFCGSEDCENTTTSCAHQGSNLHHPCCPTTTSSTSSTTTTSHTTTSTTSTSTTSTSTTTPVPNCPGSCIFLYGCVGWQLLADACDPGCDCLGPHGTPAVGTLETTGCFRAPTTTSTTTTPVPSCFGRCLWVWVDGSVGWASQGRFCGGFNPPGLACTCEPPSQDGIPCELQWTPCFFASVPTTTPGPTTTTLSGSTTTPFGSTTTTTAGGSTTTTTSTSTTTSCQPTTTANPGPCGKTCKWQWNVDITQWVLVGSDCASSCGCPYPPLGIGDSSCDTAVTPCDTTTSTTSTSTTTSSTTSTTTTTSCTGTCTWEWFTGNGWQIGPPGTGGNCTGGAIPCGCSPPTFVGFPGQFATTDCFGSTTTTSTTTTLCPTTTTPAPGACGTCTWSACCPQQSFGCSPAIVFMNCSPGCLCGNAPALCCDQTTGFAGGRVVQSCVSTSTTTGCPTTTTPSGIVCGKCTWIWQSFPGTFVVLSNNCTGPCVCTVPLIQGDVFCNSRVVTDCGSQECLPTTTPGVGPCGQCFWTWTLAGWHLDASTCGGGGLACDCNGSAPIGTGDFTCNLHVVTNCALS